MKNLIKNGIKMYRIDVLLVLFFMFPILLFAQIKDIKIISPNGGEKLTPNKHYGISWVSGSIEKVTIYYSIGKNDNWKIITKSVSADIGHYSWKTPELASDSLKIKIESEISPFLYDVSDSYSTIAGNQFKKISSQNNQNIKILPLGNSITFDNRKNDTRAVEDKIGYRFPLYNLLKNNGFNFQFIGSEHAGSNFFAPNVENDANAGFPGITTKQLRDLLLTGRRLQPQNNIDQQITSGPYLEYFPADIILIHSGTNQNEIPVEGVSPVYIEAILDEIDRIEALTSKEITVFLARIIDRVPNQSYVTTLNNNVVAMALDRVNNPANDAYPDKIVIVDMEDSAGINYTIDYMGTIGNGITGDMSDALHANDKGYAKMAQQWYNAIESVYDSPPIISQNPKPTSVIEGDTVQFKISATGVFINSFQWMRNGTNIIGANDSILVLPNVGLDYNQSQFNCVVTSFGGIAKSDTVLLNVTDRDQRVSANLQILYNFNEGSGNVIYDGLSALNPIDLTINTPNSINWISNGLAISGTASISSNNNLDKLINPVKFSDEMTIELWIKSSNIIQNGPARIITFSKDRLERNFGLFQNNNRYEFRLRTTATDNNGVPSIITDADKVTLKATHLVYTISNEDTAKLFLDGKLEKKIYLGGNFSNWNNTFSFGIANEFIDSKPWLGTFYLTAVYDRALTYNEIKHNYSLNIEGLNNIDNPSDLSSSIGTEGSIELSWTDNSSNENGFHIYRKGQSEQFFNLLSSVSENINSFIDTTVNQGRKYFYRLSAFNDFGESQFSNIDSFVTPLPRPTELSGQLNDDGFSQLNWVDNSDNELGFIIEGKPSHPDSIFSILDSIASNVDTYIDIKAKYYSPYVYRVYTFTSDTLSDFSNEISMSVVGIQDHNTSKINNYELGQNYPNPFNPTTVITYSIPEKSSVSLIVYNVLGEPVRELFKKNQDKGEYSIDFDATELSSGVYFYRFKATSDKSGKEFDDIKKLLLLK